MTIWKYSLPIQGEDHVLGMPRDAEVLCLQMQADVPALWVRVDPAAPAQWRRFRWLGTGHDATGTGRYVGTVQDPDVLVFHLFEMSEPGGTDTGGAANAE